MKLQRISQADLDRMSHAGNDALILVRPHGGAGTVAFGMGRVKPHCTANLLLRNFKTGVRRFLTNLRAPFDNNAAELMVRPVKLKPKVIGGFSAVGGSNAFCSVRSVWETRQPFRHPQTGIYDLSSFPNR